MTQRNSLWQLLAGAALCASLAACSDDSAPSDTASGQAAASTDASDHDNQRWFDRDRSIEVVLDDGELTWTDHRTGAVHELDYVVQESGDLAVTDEDKVLTSSGEFSLRTGYDQLRGRGIDVVLSRVDDEDALDDEIDQLTEKREARWKGRPRSPSDYRLIDQADVVWLLASRVQDSLSDDNLAEVFIQGYSPRLDSFAKKDLMDRELPAVKAKLAEFAAMEHFAMDSISDRKVATVVQGLSPNTMVNITSMMLGEYSQAAQGFPATISFGPCEGERSVTAFQARGLSFTFRPWAAADSPTCTIKPSNEQMARQVESLRNSSDLSSHIRVYFRMTNDRAGQFRSLVMDPHRIDIAFFGPDANGRGLTKIGETITMMEPKP